MESAGAADEGVSIPVIGGLSSCRGTFMLLVFSYRPEFYELAQKNAILESFIGRVEVPHRVMQDLPFSVFGNYYTLYYQAEHSFNYVGDYSFIDSSYAQMYLIYGVLGFILAMGICTLMQWRLMKKNMIFRMYILAIAAFFYLVQRGIFDPALHVFPLLIAAPIPGKGEWAKQEKPSEGM